LTGNRLSEKSTVNGQSSTVQYTYNELDQLITAGTTQYEYDGRGNLELETNGSDVTRYNFDAANRLASVILPDNTTISNTYDPDGRRVSQAIGTQTTSYLWDETSLYGDVVLETTAGINTSYVLAGRKLISQSRNGSTSYYLQDGQGSTRTLTDDSGSVTDSYSYTAFGEIFSQSGTTENKYLYTGQQFDESTGLYSLRARYFNPAVGRFLSQDSYSVNYNNPIELNRYGYAANSPINFSDPSGMLMVEYALNLRAKLDAAAPYAAIGMGTGALFGAISAALCGGNIFQGMVSGAALGGIAGIGAAFAPAFMAATGVTTGVIGLGMAFNDMAKHGINACNVFQAVMAAGGIAGGLYGGLAGFSGGGFGSQLAGATNQGNVILSAQGIVGNIGATAAAGIAGLVSIISGGGKGGGGSDDDVWEYTDPKTGKEYKVGPHGKMPSPRNGNESHHGVMSQWMRAIFGEKYNENEAPAVWMPKPDHQKTFGVYSKWRTMMAQDQGVGFYDMDWTLITEAQMRQLGQEMFDGAQVPQIVRDQYWSRFNVYLNALK
jgi:RHS repeat-associated protein